jgi:GYF domain 2
MKWYYAIESQPFGPVDRIELESLYQAGTITASTMVLQEGMYDWVPLVDLKKTTQFLPTFNLSGDTVRIKKDDVDADSKPEPVPEPASKTD